MKTKKKSIQTKSINTIKLLNIKTVEQQKITNSTNQKTFATIEENIRTYENSDTQFKRQSLKARFSFNKKSCVQRMQQNNLSPFSNDGRSFSPKYRKTPQKLLSAREDKETKFALNLKQFQKKKPKSKPNSGRQTRQVNQNNNKKVVINKTVVNNNNLPNQQVKKKPVIKKKPIKQDKKQKQQKARIQFQNQFLNMMNNRIQKQKITEMSQQDLECSIKRKPKLQIVITNSEASSRQQKYYERNSDKGQIVKTMKLKIMRNINRDYPNLDHSQKKVMSAIIIIQRLWRQRKVKQFFQHYLTPRGSFQSSSFRGSLQKEVSSNRSTLNLLSSHMAVKKPQESHSCQTVPKKKISSTKNEPQPTFQQNNFLIRQPSAESVKKQQKNSSQHPLTQKESKLNEKVNKLLQDSILSFQNENEKIVNETSNQLDRPSMIKFVECYRQVKLNKKTSKSKRNNIFSLKQSLSQKCLMQKYYQRIFADKPQKDKPKNYELFSLAKNNHSNLGNQSLKLNQQSSIQLFKQINRHPDYISPQKLLKKKENENNSQQMKQQQQQSEQIWIRNDTTYSHETDSDQLVIKNDNYNKVIQSPKKQVLIKVDDISRQNESFNKLNNDKQQTNLQIECLSPKKVNQEIDKNKFNQDQSRDKVQKHKLQQPLHIGISIQQQQSNDDNIVKTSNDATKPQQYSLKSIQHTADAIMTQLMDEFFKQYLSFQQKQCLVKKRKHKEEQKQKKPKLPGIQISQKSITQYLNILIPYILSNDRQQILRSLELFHPNTYQKCHRVESAVYEIFQFADEEQDDIYWNIISNQGFFLCLQKYWQENVTLSKQNQKFTNFLDLTYKVYNRCITDAFSQIFNKLVLQSVSYPWNSIKRGKDNSRLRFQKQIKAIINEHEIQTIAQQVKQRLLKQSFCYSTTGGKLIKKQRKHTKKQKPTVIKQYQQFGQNLQQQKNQQQYYEQDQLLIQKLSQDEFSKVMKIANDEFLQDEKQLIYCVDERYQLNGDLAEVVLGQLLVEMESQMNEISVRRELLCCLQEEELEQMLLLTKSKQEVFLETNQTLQTNYHQ